VQALSNPFLALWSAAVAASPQQEQRAQGKDRGIRQAAGAVCEPA
jgi:hypothetical protein